MTKYMQGRLGLKHIFFMLLCCSFVMPVMAEPAPVYDVDSMSQQFDSDENNNEQIQQDLPPPPPPNQDSLFVPMQPMSNASQDTNNSPQQDINNSNSSQQVNNNPSQDMMPPLPQERGMVALPSRPMSVDQRIRRVEQQVNNMQGSDLHNRINSLQMQVQLMRDQLEQMNHQLEMVQNQQRTVLAEVDKRLSAQSAASKVSAVVQTEANNLSRAAHKSLSSSASSKSQAKAATDAESPSIAKLSDNQPNVAEEQQIYQTAYNFIKAKKYNDAVSTLQNMLKKYPSGQFASNAHYWLGELFGLMGKNDQALAEFGIVVKSYPNSPRVSDAQLKVGLIYAALSKWADAKNAFKRVINHYPGTAPARLASEQLKQIKQAGH